MCLGKCGTCPPATAHKGPGLPRTIPPPYGITSLSVPRLRLPAYPFPGPRPTGPTLASLTFSGLGAQRPGSLPEHQHQEPELAPHGGRQDPPPTRCSRALAREGPGLGGAVLGADGRRGGLRGGGGEPGQARRRERRARERAGSEQSGGGQERSPGGGGAGGAAPPELSPVFPGPSLPFPRAPAAAPQARTEGV